MSPKDIKLEMSTMCHPDYDRWTRNIPGKKKHYIVVENNRIHTYKLVDGKRVPCNEGRCRIIREEFYEDVQCATSYRYEPYTNRFLPDAIKVFIRETVIPLREKRTSEHRLGWDHLEYCAGVEGMGEKAAALRAQWILDQRLQARSVSQEHRDAILAKVCVGNLYGWHYSASWKRAFATLRFIDWLEYDGYPTIECTSYSGETCEYPVQVSGHSRTNDDGIWCPTEKLGDSDWVLAWCGDTPHRIYRDGRPHEKMFRVKEGLND